MFGVSLLSSIFSLALSPASVPPNSSTGHGVYPDDGAPEVRGSGVLPPFFPGKSLSHRIWIASFVYLFPPSTSPPESVTSVNERESSAWQGYSLSPPPPSFVVVELPFPFFALTSQRHVPLTSPLLFLGPFPPPCGLASRPSRKVRQSPGPGINGINPSSGYLMNSFLRTPLVRFARADNFPPLLTTGFPEKDQPFYPPPIDGPSRTACFPSLLRS